MTGMGIDMALVEEITSRASRVFSRHSNWARRIFKEVTRREPFLDTDEILISSLMGEIQNLVDELRKMISNQEQGIIHILEQDLSEYPEQVILWARAVSRI